MTGYTTLTVLPAAPVKIETTASSNTFVKGQKATILVRLLDTFGNLANGNIYTLKASTSAGNFLDTDGKSLGGTTEKGVIEGYTSFDVTSASAQDAINLKFRLDRQNLESSILSLRAVDFAKTSVDIDARSSIVA